MFERSISYCHYQCSDVKLMAYEIYLQKSCLLKKVSLQLVVGTYQVAVCVVTDQQDPH